MKKHKKIQKPSALSVVLAIAAVCLEVFLIAAAMEQFALEEWFSGIVSTLGAVLILVAIAVVAVDLWDRQQEKQ